MMQDARSTPRSARASPEEHSLPVETGADRLDRFLAARLAHLSRARVQRLILDGFVTVDGMQARPSRRLRAGERIDVLVPPPEPIELTPDQDLPIEVVYQDEALLVIDKPAGVPVHPGAGHAVHTLVHGLLALSPDLSRVGGELRPGIVHRLDKDTSGLMIVAKHDAAHRRLADQLKRRTVEKRYLALVWGIPAPGEGVVDAPIARDPGHRKRMAVVPTGRHAATRYTVLEAYDGCSLVEARPVTGRTHQIRVHLASIGHPLVGDPVYGRRRVRGLDRQFLHASYLGLTHPVSGERLSFESPLPEDLKTVLEEIRTELRVGKPPV